MLRSLNSGVSGLQQFQQQIDVIGNNIANSNTIGFKGGRATFADTFSQTLQSGGSQSMQVGTGVGTASITDNFTAGTLNNTGRNGDLAIQGSGFFVVSDSVTGSQFATRDGAFSMDANGYIVNTSGLRLQGFSDSALTTRGDIRVTVPGGTPAGVTVNGFSFNDAGIVTGKLSDGTTFTAGQVLLQRFQSPQSLVKEGGNLYSGFAAAGALAQTEVPSASGSGLLKVNSLELSNVELTSEFATLITSQRGFQASARIITTSDEVLQEVVNLKR